MVELALMRLLLVEDETGLLDALAYILRKNKYGVELRPLNSEVACDKKRIKLTMKETQLLELFMRNAGQVITRDQILNRVWGLDSDVEMNNVEIYIYYLRKKLELFKHLIR
jgi:DNA-binding response OmpR family regulator